MNKEIRRVSNLSALPVLLFVLFGQIAVSGLQLAAALLPSAHVNIPSEALTLAAYTLLYPVGGGLALLVFYKTRTRVTGLRLRQVFCKPQMPAGWIVKWSVITWGLGLLTSVITRIGLTLLQELLHVELDSPSFGAGDGIWGGLVLFVSLSLYAPLFEELLFRSAVYRHTEIMGQGFAILFSAAMFALMHGNLTQLFYTFTVGMGFAFLFAKTRSILPSMLLHFCINTVSVLASVFLPTDAEDISALLQDLTSVDVSGLLGLTAYAMMNYGLMITAIVLGIIELVRALRRHDRLRGGIFPIAGFKKTLVFLSAPVTVVTLALMLLLLVANTISLSHPA